MARAAHNGVNARMDTAARDANRATGGRALLSQAQRKPFIVMANKVVAYAGSAPKAAKLLGVADFTLRQLLADEMLTSRTGHTILARYRGIKHHL